jgi:hypothetical protein
MGRMTMQTGLNNKQHGPIYFLYKTLSGMTVEALAAAVAGSQFLLPGDDGAPRSRALSVPGAPPP